MVLGTVQKPVRRLRRSLKGLPMDPSIEAVHNLRTSTRRIEAIVAALQMDQKKPARRMLKTIKAVHKAAGAVRDMDVMAGNAQTLAGNGRDESVLRLLQHLHDLRIESARQLVDAVDKNRKDARRSLKRFAFQIEKWFKGSKPGEAHWTANGPYGHAATTLLNELRHWPELNAGNLHAFRIKVKELRYVLQLAKNPDSGLLGALDEAKEKIGDWHDWEQLSQIAEKTLEPDTDSAALKQISDIELGKFGHALQAAEEVKAFTPFLRKPVTSAAGLAAESCVA